MSGIEHLSALVPTFLLSRLLLWIMRSWDGGYSRIWLAHAVSFLIAFVLAGYGYGNGARFAADIAIALYGPAQLFWALVDSFRVYRATRTA